MRRYLLALVVCLLVTTAFAQTVKLSPASPVPSASTVTFTLSGWTPILPTLPIWQVLDPFSAKPIGHFDPPDAAFLAANPSLNPSCGYGLKVVWHSDPNRTGKPVTCLLSCNGIVFRRTSTFPVLTPQW